MPAGASGTPSTNFGFYKLSTSADAPNGTGLNLIIDSIDTELQSKVIRKSLLTTTGDIIYASAASTPARLAAGAVGTILTSGGAGVAPSWAAAAGLPPGAIIEYGGATAPSGYLLCDGATVSRTTYADLFAVVSTLYNIGGEAGTDFRLPDMRGRVPVGYAASGGHVDVSTLGLADAVSLANRRPKHKHTVTDPGHTHVVSSNRYGGAGSDAGIPRKNLASSDLGTNASDLSNATTGITVGTASDQDHAPAYLVVNFIIKT